MRIITSFIVILIFFAGGLLGGLMYEPASQEQKQAYQAQNNEAQKREPENSIEAELIELNDFPHEKKIVKREQVDDHPIEKVASMFEKMTTFFFEKVTLILYSIVDLLF